MIFKVKVERHKSNNWMSGGEADVFINGVKHHVRGDRPDILDGMDLEGAITGAVLDAVMDSFGVEVNYRFLHYFGYWRCGGEVYKWIHTFEGKSDYTVDGDELKVLYDLWVKEELPEIERKDREWKEKNDKLEREGKPRDDTYVSQRVVIDTQPISSEHIIKWNEVNLKPYNVIELNKVRAKATKQLAEDQKFMALLNTAKKAKKKVKKSRRKPNGKKGNSK